MEKTKKIDKRTPAEKIVAKEKMAKLRAKKGTKEKSFIREEAGWAKKTEIVEAFNAGTSISEMETKFKLGRHSIAYVLVRMGLKQLKGNPSFESIFKAQNVVPETVGKAVMKKVKSAIKKIKPIVKKTKEKTPLSQEERAQLEYPEPMVEEEVEEEEEGEEDEEEIEK